MRAGGTGDFGPGGRRGRSDGPPASRGDHQVLRQGPGRGPALHLHRARRERGPARALRVRQDHHPQRDRGIPQARRGHGANRRPRRLRGSHQQAQPRHGVPELRPVPAHDGRGERRLRTQAQAHRAAGVRPAGPRSARHGAPVRPFRPLHEATLGRPAAAGRARPGAGGAARDHALRRAPVEPRCEAARGDAHGAARASRPRQHHQHLRHPRPGRSAGSRRPGGGHERRADRAARYARRGLREARDRLRRQVPRRIQRPARDRLAGERHRGGVRHRRAPGSRRSERSTAGRRS